MFSSHDRVLSWDPEFEPSAEEIVDYPMIYYGNSLSSLSLASLLSGGFPYSIAGEGQPAQVARPNIIRIYGACAVCQCVLVRVTHEGLWM